MEATLNDVLDYSVNFWPKNIALVFVGKKMTYQALGDQVERLASSLQGLGVQKGDRVAVMLPNCPQNVIAYFAILRLGAIVVQCNPQYQPNELEYQLKNCGAKTLIALDLLWEKVEPVRGLVRDMIVTSIVDYLPFPINFLYRLKRLREPNPIKKVRDLLRFKDLVRSKKENLSNVVVNPNDIAVLQYTGGTTGVSKGAILIHANLVVNIHQVREWFPDAKDGQERIFTVLPMFHCFGMTICQNFTILLGGTMILVPNPRDLEKVLEAIDKYKPTVFPGIPRLYMAINVAAEKRKSLDFSSIKYCISGSAALPDVVLERFEALTGGVLVEGFGLTEASPVTHCNPLDRNRRKKGSIGQVLPETRAKIVDDNGQELPLGESGELIINGPQVMQGYWNMPEETMKTLRQINGEIWLFTGDIAKVDSDGYFYIVDRKKDMINVGGENVFSLEVEDVLYQHPMVAEAAVVGVKDKRGDEEVKAFIVRRESLMNNEELVRDIKNFCRERLTTAKVPKRIEFLKEIPKTLIGKPDKKALRKLG